MAGSLGSIHIQQAVVWYVVTERCHGEAEHKQAAGRQRGSVTVCSFPHSSFPAGKSWEEPGRTGCRGEWRDAVREAELPCRQVTGREHGSAAECPPFLTPGREEPGSTGLRGETLRERRSDCAGCMVAWQSVLLSPRPARERLLLGPSRGPWCGEAEPRKAARSGALLPLKLGPSGSNWAELGSLPEEVIDNKVKGQRARAAETVRTRLQLSLETVR
ncbi:hypothetical protein NDU88_005630 [Pleurodeles waltl]|uniref:Uncharacterized protein n=1 Tax=Pleurodeles waltl TaxID=8319 RepID=A0AAV7SM71_PLEWA|nr:hypothetical protein NDU88_005630 [Pleurodeles waltl]